MNKLVMAVGVMVTALGFALLVSPNANAVTAQNTASVKKCKKSYSVQDYRKPVRICIPNVMP
jgi:hypothetical protein